LSRWPEAFVRAALKVPGEADAQRSYTEISTDTRTLGPGALFVALRGPRFDGHDYLRMAVTGGASGAVVDRGTPPVEGLVLYEVVDTLEALGSLAREARRLVRGPVIAVTGTNGKTSTKEMLAAVLRLEFATHATRENLNNLIGVPLTILSAPPETEALVLEAGSNEPGELARHREIIDPTITVITNVGAGHLEGFGTIQNVLREKLELARDVHLAVVGTTPPELGRAVREWAGTAITAGLSAADVVPEQVTVDPNGHAGVSIDGHAFSLPNAGLHLAANAMLAWAVARALDLDLAACASALEQVTLPEGRGQVITSGGMTVVNDAYNANPESFAAAIETARTMRGGRPLVFVAGTMLELGPRSRALHAEVMRLLVELDPAILAVVGDFVPASTSYAAELGSRLVTASDPVALGPVLAERLAGDELVFLKASRGVALERILQYLLDRTDQRR
jgi:UDP-N-acetylmuramoyl-tripeptide--D-alanyl-D-alanine ligase